MSFNYYRNRVLMKGDTNQKRITYENKKSFDEYLNIAPNAYKVKISETEYLVAIQDRQFNNEMLEDKYLIAHIDIPVNIGDYVLWDNINWIIISKENESIKSRQSFKIAKCTNTLTFQDPTDLSTIHHIPCVLKDKTSVYSDGVNQGKYITLADDQVLIQVPNNEITLSIPEGKRFIFNNKRIFKLSRIDDLTQPGIINLIMKKDEKGNDDRLDLNIANYVEPNTPPIPEPTGYSMTIEGADEIRLGEVQTYTANVYADGVLVEKVVNWSVDDTTRVTIARITDGTCDLKASEKFDAMGEVKLTAKLVDDETVVGDKWIEVIGLW